MADPPQQEAKEEKEKGFSLFKPSEWPGFVWNWFWRLPYLERAGVGRSKVGKRKHPIEKELRKVWLPKNDDLFAGPLEIVERTWGSESHLVGFGDSKKGELIDHNPKGIVRLYMELGAYADKDRIETERDWFQFGTGFKVETAMYELPPETEWGNYGWGEGEKPELKAIYHNNLIKLKQDKSEPWKRIRHKKLVLEPGVVFHEAKLDLREELYCFGYHRLRALGDTLKKFSSDVHLENMRHTKTQVEIRNKMAKVIETFEGLFHAVAEIEEKTYLELSGLTAKISTWTKLWEELINYNTPERVKIFIRFPHTFRIIKIYYLQEIKGEKIKWVDDEGEIHEEVDKIIITDEKGRPQEQKIVSHKTVYFDPSKNTFVTELQRVNKRIQDLGGEASLKREAEEAKVLAGRFAAQGNEVEKVKALMKRKEILELLFKKEKLEFYNKELLPQNPRFNKRPEEIDYGLDENGWPLEIDVDGKITGKNGAVLIDFWWNEIAENEWQLETIALKPGGADVLKIHLGADVEYYEEEDKITKKKKLRAKVKNCKRAQRYIDDDRFYGYVDLLDAGAIIFGIWDTVRDDLRDGRYHLHSKSVGDYVIEGMGGFDENEGAPYIKNFGELSRGGGLYVTRKGIIPKKSAAVNVRIEDPKYYKYAKPKDFDTTEKHPNVVYDDAIKRDFKMKLTADIAKIPGFSARNSLEHIETTPFGTFYNGTRIPTKYNTAFDRRAEKFNYMHWGVMYYYEWSQNVNKWSENPFPHISTRGIALYIAHRVASDVWYYKEGEDVLEGHKFDYGVRGQGEFGLVNPLSGKGVLQEN